jgi:hypothetical protein
MIAGTRGTWQTVMADLALILFMVTAGAMGHREKRPADAHLPPRGEPLAVYRPHDGAPSLRHWLAEQAPDDRQRLTIVSRYTPGQAAAAADAALAMAGEANGENVDPRIVIEPADRSELVALLAFDRDRDWHDDCVRVFADGARRAAGKDSSCP